MLEPLLKRTTGPRPGVLRGIPQEMFMKRYAAVGVHDRVLSVMAAFAEKGDLLDIPTGQGALAEDLENLGFRVFAGDLARENIAYRNGRCIQFDLNESIPIRRKAVDSSFVWKG